ncbi:SDR family NAD(P)-dependent oxidoreductase [Thiomicrorhabdus heinhorstiae]|uniref:SDR family oxidoreductase n=1 Tax=Thiomicrorhabdus heinhorstiae TaxID=2748010 RepID=A0ABS0BUH4_9GAMM|nr:SDR family oxidoreductase [Thiomicrorhabdus heinhorstiae]MBF6057483.1 SDR family oxidoreductase [Thiomicrorhabdus heinhorstiae]
MKVALVTGGSRGLGKNMAVHLAQKGYHLIVTYKQSEAQALETVKEIEVLGRQATALQLDASDPASLDAFAEKVSSSLRSCWQTEQLDLLVNNAGIGIHVSMADTTEAQFDELMNIHVKTPFFLTQKLLASLKDGGSIINISSGLARFSLPGFGAYAMMKGAVEVMTRYLAAELGSRQITVNTIAPGAIETDFGGGLVRDNRDANALIASKTALGRAGKADDIGAALANLVSDECKWLNGQRIELSGGMFL